MAYVNEAVENALVGHAIDKDNIYSGIRNAVLADAIGHGTPVSPRSGHFESFVAAFALLLTSSSALAAEQTTAQKEQAPNSSEQDPAAAQGVVRYSVNLDDLPGAEVFAQTGARADDGSCTFTGEASEGERARARTGDYRIIVRSGDLRPQIGTGRVRARPLEGRRRGANSFESVLRIVPGCKNNAKLTLPLTNLKRGTSTMSSAGVGA